MTGDRQRGLDALTLWYNGTPLSSVRSLDDVVAFYDGSHPTFIENLGSAVRAADLSQDRLVGSLGTITNNDASKLPAPDSFFQALAGEVTTLRYEDFKAIAEKTISQTVSTVETAAALGAAAYVSWIVGGIVVLLVLQHLEKRSA